MFGPGQVIRADLLAGLSGATVLHAAGHAKHDFEDCSRSALHVSDGSLSLKELMASIPTDGHGRVVLSACETGIAPATLADEGLTFAGAFLRAGQSGS